ncbi:MAG: flagellar biosynthetic protein FliO [Nitrospirota bacterium]
MRKKYLIAAFAVIFLLCSRPAWAGGLEKAASPPIASFVPQTARDTGGAPGFPVARVIISLAAVGAAMYISYRLLKKYAPGKITRAGEEGPLNIVSTVPVGLKSSLILVDAMGRNMLLALSDGKLSFLASLDGNVEKAGAPDEKPVAAPELPKRRGRPRKRPPEGSFREALDKPAPPEDAPVLREREASILEKIKMLRTM